MSPKPSMDSISISNCLSESFIGDSAAPGLGVGNGLPKEGTEFIELVGLYGGQILWTDYYVLTH